MATQSDDTPTNVSTIQLRPDVLLPVLVLVGYAAFVTTGFGGGLGSLQPLPIYLYVSVLLLLLQVYLANFRSVPRSLYGIAAAIFGLVFAAEASFFTNDPNNFTRSPVTFLIINIVAVIVFGFDAVQRHLQTGTRDPLAGRSVSLRFYRTLATDFAGLAILFGLSSFLLDLWHTRSSVSFLGFTPPNKPITVDLNSLFGFTLPEQVHFLEGFDLALAFVMATIWLLIIVVIGALTGAGVQSGATTPANQTASTSLLDTFRTIIQRGFGEATYSLRSVLQIYLWLIPAFSIANFANVSTDYFNAAARAHVSLAELFNPVSATSLSNIGRGFVDIALAVVAVIAVVATVSVAEFNTEIITNTIKQIGVFGRIISLTLIFFTLALALTNAAVNLFGFSDATPFQVGAATVFALCLFIGNAIFSMLASRVTTTTPAPAEVH